MISAKCLTYGRVAFLEEALFSFLNQSDLEGAELVIVNDYPLQTLIFEHPQVKIFNLKKTFKTIGEKENFTIEQCKGPLIATYDDDDIALSNHFANIKKYFTPETNILHWKGGYYNHPNLTSIVHLGNSGMVFTKDIWEKVGRSPIMNAGGDTVFRDAVHKLGGVTDAYPLDEEIGWFYRWYMPVNGGVYHQSGAGFDVLGQPNIIQRHAAHIEYLRKQKLIPTGEIVLNPHWDLPYDQILKDFVNKKTPS